MDLHAPLHPNKHRTDSGNKGGINSTLRHFAADGARISEKYHPRYGAMYDRVLGYVDRQVERLVHDLRKQGLWNNSILIITGDHGEALGERGFYAHPWHYMFDELLHVPLMVRTPNCCGRRITQLFSLGWLHELISEVSGIPSGPFPANSKTGRHLEDNEQNLTVISDSVSVNGYSAAIRNREYKFIEHRMESVPDYVLKTGDMKNTYRISQDKGESSPLHPGEAPKHLRSFMEEIHVRPDQIRSLEQGLDPSAVKQLEQLGYLS